MVRRCTAHFRLRHTERDRFRSVLLPLVATTSNYTTQQPKIRHLHVWLSKIGKSLCVYVLFVCVRVCMCACVRAGGRKCENCSFCIDITWSVKDISLCLLLPDTRRNNEWQTHYLGWAYGCLRGNGTVFMDWCQPGLTWGLHLHWSGAEEMNRSVNVLQTGKNYTTDSVATCLLCL